MAFNILAALAPHPVLPVGVANADALLGPMPPASMTGGQMTLQQRARVWHEVLSGTFAGRGTAADPHWLVCRPATFRVDQEPLRVGAKPDFHGVVHQCSVLRNRNKYLKQIKSIAAYNFSMAHKALVTMHGQGPVQQSLLADLAQVNRQGGFQIRHLCGNEECCEATHLDVTTQDQNEKDKHFHFFANDTSKTAADRARVTQFLWQEYPAFRNLF
jgi:hypothetical protein